MSFSVVLFHNLASKDITIKSTNAVPILPWNCDRRSVSQYSYWHMLLLLDLIWRNTSPRHGLVRIREFPWFCRYFLS